MARISKGFAITTAVFGVLAFIFGLALAICAWKLQGKVAQFSLSTSDQTVAGVTFHDFWWGGLFYCVPGILGIIVGCTRNVCAMTFYLIMNLICMVSSVIVTAFCGIILLAWAILETLNNEGRCDNNLFIKQCTCTDVSGTVYNINGLSCNDVRDVQPNITALIGLASLSSLIAFVASYIACCGLCNKEQETPGAVIIQPGAGSYQPPTNIIVSNSTSHTQQYAAPAPNYPYQPPQYPYHQPAPAYGPPQPAPTHDKAGLVRNEVI